MLLHLSNWVFLTSTNNHIHSLQFPFLLHSDPRWELQRVIVINSCTGYTLARLWCGLLVPYLHAQTIEHLNPKDVEVTLPGRGAGCIARDSCQKCICTWSPGTLSRSPSPPCWPWADFGVLAPAQEHTQKHCFNTSLPAASVVLHVAYIQMVHNTVSINDLMSRTHFYAHIHPSIHPSIRCAVT